MVALFENKNGDFYLEIKMVALFGNKKWRLLFGNKNDGIYLEIKMVGCI